MAVDVVANDKKSPTIEIEIMHGPHGGARFWLGDTPLPVLASPGWAIERLEGREVRLTCSLVARFKNPEQQLE